MSLRHALLAALAQGEASGYELAKRFDVGVANFWSATPQQLYRDLERLEQDGLVSARVVEQTRRPNKRVFELTAEGRDELRAFGARPAKPPAMRDEFLVKLQAVDPGEPGAIIAAAAERIGRSREKLAGYDQMRERMLSGRDEDEYLRESEQVGPYLTLMAGRMYEQMNIRWATTVIETLTNRQATASG
ncbi:PadR family transcriptional regulator [Actinoplanes sp. TRM 88003]|uniref:PadR family transcriptional regulator n=1 Tax=Paractinoplanes aksuensis TaxID=2939490 RepID=A0ABT1DKW9_9ACTN|nr:PadR family transcriptional regulator [Actinoplanes aksuensis]MCO8271475.1 PadR family transcriptional regulator [Actinoplanes aksuensis]